MYFGLNFCNSRYLHFNHLIASKYDDKTHFNGHGHLYCFLKNVTHNDILFLYVLSFGTTTKAIKMQSMQNSDIKIAKREMKEAGK